MLINYKIISDAIEFYSKYGYKYIEVPWAVSKKSIDVTRPNHAKLYPYLDEFNKEKFLIASGEQSFIEMMQKNKLRKFGKKIMCVTPCFRSEEKYDEYHLPYFMKLELIDLDESDDFNKRILEMVNISFSFFNQYINKGLKTIISETENNFQSDIIDIVFKSSDDLIELGSYGKRYHDTTGNWIFGTGVAEPRFSQALNKIPNGYSVNKIPKGEIGEVSKIQEEFEELKDALDQGSKIMSLVELSDMYGAIECFLNKKFNMTMDDLKNMSNITKRAFKNGYRN